LEGHLQIGCSNYFSVAYRTEGGDYEVEAGDIDAPQIIFLDLLALDFNKPSLPVKLSIVSQVNPKASHDVCDDY
jgi:hypothetical protein